ncbi:MAG: 5'-nucleotidase C-terminal domain-containing protein [Blastocatellia bacterium]|nr:5'-nucleotidase C-terminal domain-containing protein [Blastocatellia bacterium]
MIRVKTALISGTLLLLSLALSGESAKAQVARPAPAPTPSEVHARVSETVVDRTIPDDKAVDKMLKVYAPKVRALDVVIGKLKGELRKGGIGSGSLGNFVTNGIRQQASLKLGKPVALAVTNGGGLRKSVISEGELRERDIFELLPFENALVAFDLTGAQVLDLLRVVVSHRDAQAGARIKYGTGSDKTPELETVRLLIDGAEKEIDPNATYTVVSIDYLMNRRSSKPSATEGDYSILRAGKNINPIGLTIRDAMINYVKSETAAGREIRPNLDGRFIFDKSGSATPEQPQ